MDRRRYLEALSALSAAGLAGCGGDAPTSPGSTGTETQGTSTPTARRGSSDTATSTPTETPTPSQTPTPLPPVAAEVAVGAGNGFQFDPESVTVSTGDTVRWVWESPGHNVKPGDVPSGADWSGTPGDAGETFSAGYIYTHTFEVAGTYEYYCAPHRSSGMTGSVTVE